MLNSFVLIGCAPIRPLPTFVYLLLVLNRMANLRCAGPASPSSIKRQKNKIDPFAEPLG